jgi:hypothetical protein
MGQLAQAIAADSVHKGPACGIAAILPKLSDEDREDLDTAFADVAVTGAAIVRGLKVIGHKVDDNALRKHRKGECNCGTTR